jgi:penicillin-binding protein 1C
MIGRRRVWCLGAIAIAAAIGVWLRVGPLPAGPLDFSGAESTVVVDRAGEVLYEARSDGGSRTTLLRAEALPPIVVAATVAAEDHRFWSHHGIDPLAIARAVARGVRRRRFSEGGSTITQQAAKLLLARHAAASSRGIATKVREGVLALRLEHRLSKREILALYLNLAPYGNQLVGVESASRTYFGCGAALLTPAQAAFLAALPQRPSTFNPYRDPERVRRRQRYVIERMAALGWLSAGAAREALAEHLAFKHEPAVFLAPHFVQRALSATVASSWPQAATVASSWPQAATVASSWPQTVAGAGRPHRVATTLDADLQRDVEGIIRSQRVSLERSGAHNVAAVVLDNATGEWLAWEGSGDYADAAHGGNIDGVVTPRQPGSALKPFTYALAFEEGETPATVLPDVPSYFPTAQSGVLYSPRNYDGRFRGPLLARRALAGSENVPAVALASRIGVPSLLRFLRRAGLTTFDKTAAYYGLGVTLGDAEVRLDELVAAYSAFARGGVILTPTMIRADRAARRTQETLMSSRTAFWISDILSDADARAFAFGRGGSLEFPFAVAAKTGTSQAYRDNWAIGYTRAVTVGVWVGNFDRTPLVNSSGVTGAGPIFHAIMLAAERRVAGGLPQLGEAPTEARPERVERRAICALSGMPASRWCPAQIDEWAAAGANAAACTWHIQTPAGVTVQWPAEFRAWALSQRQVARSVALPRPQPPQAMTPPDAPVVVLNPPPGAVYLIDPTLRREFQTLPLRASAVARGRIEWRVDGQRVGSCEADAALDWTLAPGRHTVTARDGYGHQSNAAILVK